MIEYQTGDLLGSDAEALVNTVNCVGVMGKGIALQFKKAFPDNFKVYAKACKQDEVAPGRMLVTERLDSPKYIINFPTKRHWRAKSRMADVESGLAALADEIRERQISSIAIPPLGSGLGGLDWSDVRSRIEESLGRLPDVRVLVYEPEGTPDAKVMASLTEAPEMTPGRAALVVLMRCYLTGQPKPTITSLEVHKLMYFLQAAGQPLDISYTKERYGPYAGKLDSVLRKIEGHWISGYSDSENKSVSQLKLVPGAVEDAEDFLRSVPDNIDCIDKVTDLIDGFESSLGLELLSAVHWAIHKERIMSIDDIVRSVSDGRFYRKQIVQAYETLAGLDWLHHDGSPPQVTSSKLADVAETHVSTGMPTEQGCNYSDTDDNPARVNINAATANDLEALPSIGSKLAQAIITHREKNGSFSTTRDITAVSGIGNGLYKRIAGLITVGHRLL